MQFSWTHLKRETPLLEQLWLRTLPILFCAHQVGGWGSLLVERWKACPHPGASGFSPHPSFGCGLSARPPTHPHPHHTHAALSGVEKHTHVDTQNKPWAVWYAESVDFWILPLFPLTVLRVYLVPSCMSTYWYGDIREDSSPSSGASLERQQAVRQEEGLSDHSMVTSLWAPDSNCGVIKLNSTI